MKNLLSITKTSDRYLLRKIKTLGFIFFIGNLVSCSSGLKSNSSSTQVTFQSEHWHKVSNNPPTYFPRGVSANHPTGMRHGSWVYTGDKAQTSYFIPLHRVDSSNLISEAQTMMTPSMRKELNKGRGIDWSKSGDIFKKGLLGMGQGLMEIDERITRQTGRAPVGGALHDAQNQYNKR